MKLLVELNVHPNTSALALDQFYQWAKALEMGTVAPRSPTERVTETHQIGDVSHTVITASTPSMTAENTSAGAVDAGVGDASAPAPTVPAAPATAAPRRPGRPSRAETEARKAQEATAATLPAGVAPAQAAIVAQLASAPPGPVSGWSPTAALGAGTPTPGLSPAQGWAPPASPPVAAPTYQPAAMPQPGPAPAPIPGAPPTLEDVSQMMIDTNNRLGAGTCFKLFKPFGWFRAEAIPAEKRLEAMEMMATAQAGG